MPNRYEEFARLKQQAENRLISGEWTDFLHIAASFYKYSFTDQVLIYAQRPDASACADFDTWNKRMNRSIRRGAKGIALLDDSGPFLRVRYVFDVSDTIERQQARAPQIWKLEQRHIGAVCDRLADSYGTADGGLPEQLLQAARRAISDGEEVWRDTAVKSCAYILFTRCGLDTAQYFRPEDFAATASFSPEQLETMGGEMNRAANQILRQIGRAIQEYERGMYHGREDNSREGREDGPDLPLGGGRASAGDGTGEQRTASEPVRDDAEGISEGKPARAVHASVDERGAVPPDAPGGRSGGTEASTAYGEAAGTGRSNRETESWQPGAVGETDGRLPDTGRGDHSGRARLRQERNGQISLFATAAGSSAANTSIRQEDIDHFLRLGGNTDAFRARVITLYEQQKPLEEIAAALPGLYRGGSGVITETGRIAAWYGEDGIRLAHGDSARENASQVIPWQATAERIGELLETGRFAANVELAEAAGQERARLAEQLWYLYHDFSDEGRESGYLPSLAGMSGGNFPEETGRLAAQLEHPEFRADLQKEYQEFMDAYRANPHILRFH